MKSLRLAIVVSRADLLWLRDVLLIQSRAIGTYQPRCKAQGSATEGIAAQGLRELVFRSCHRYWS